MTALNFPDSPTNGEVYEGYIYDSSDNVWNRLPEAPGINLENLGNVAITSVATDEVLAYDGSNWVNAAAGGGFTASTTITANDAAWPVPALGSPIVKVTAIGGGGGGGPSRSPNQGATGGSTTFNAGGAGTVTATGGTGGLGSNDNRDGTPGFAGFTTNNGGQGGVDGFPFEGFSGFGGFVTVAYLDLTGISTVNVTIGAGGAGGAAGTRSGGAGGAGQVILEFVAG